MVSVVKTIQFFLFVFVLYFLPLSSLFFPHSFSAFSSSFEEKGE
jgi:hypothetical protein